MRTRRSVRNQNILFRELFQPVKVVVEKARPAYLDMSDEQIDKTYFYFGKSDRTRMKKEAARERLRSKIVNDPAVCAANAEAALGAAAGLTKRAADVLPCGHSAGIEFGESSWSCVVCGQSARR